MLNSAPKSYNFTDFFFKTCLFGIPTHEIFCAKAPFHADTLSGSRDLNFALSLYLHSYFVYASREGSDVSAQSHSLLDNAIRTKILCVG